MPCTVGLPSILKPQRAGLSPDSATYGCMTLSKLLKLPKCQFLICKMEITIAPNYRAVWRRQWHPTLVLLPGKSYGWRSLEGCGPWGCWGSDMTERLHFHFSLSCIGEGNGNPLQCPCLENPRDRGAWWAAVYGVARSRTRLKWLSSSSSIGLWEEFN